jgi:hypothetical protein
MNPAIPPTEGEVLALPFHATSFLLFHPAMPKTI